MSHREITEKTVGEIERAIAHLGDHPARLRTGLTIVVLQALRLAEDEEREACAAVADAWSVTTDGFGFEISGGEIADLIRARATPPPATSPRPTTTPDTSPAGR